VSSQSEAFTPAAGRFLPVGAYDVITRLVMRETRWRPQLVADLAGRSGHDPSIVEVGAGTGLLTRELVERLPEAAIVAVEPDDRARAIAAAGGRTGNATWCDARAEDLPLADESQDAVVMALMLHHLVPDAKRLALAEAHRVTKPGGALYVADFVQPQDPLMAALFTIIQLADGRASTADHRAGRLPDFIRDAGFSAPERVVRLRTPAGTFEVLRCPIAWLATGMPEERLELPTRGL
jgi:ubiquinone/menaquinone biosynthesis C-methylase UbiE